MIRTLFQLKPHLLVLSLGGKQREKLMMMIKGGFQWTRTQRAILFFKRYSLSSHKFDWLSEW